MAWDGSVAASGQLPPTYFAPPDRARSEDLAGAVRAAGESPLVSALMAIFGGIVVVLNQHRQTVAVNDGLLRFLGVPDAEGLLGLRPGEAFGCSHAHDHPAGCGTSRFCSTCGATIAIVLAQQSGEPAERECLLTLDRGRATAVELQVRAAPLDLEGHRLVLLLLRDIRGEKRRQALERIFFHDLLNSIQGLMGCADLLKRSGADSLPVLAARIGALVDGLADEVRTQQVLGQAEAGEYAVQRAPVCARSAFEEVRAAASVLPAAAGKSLELPAPAEEVTVHTDPVLLHRILFNMVKNALEATPPGGTVECRCSATRQEVAWEVWNDGEIPEAVAGRVFQRYFSTKGEGGRGLGTYGMKLLGEQILGGSVGFATSRSGGTVFRFRLPLVEH